MAEHGLASGWRIGQFFGITIRLHFSWVIIFLLLAYSLGAEILPLSSLADGGPWWEGAKVKARAIEFATNRPGTSLQEAYSLLGINLWPHWQYWMLAVIGTLGLFICVVAHELSHSVVTRARAYRWRG